MSRVTEQEWRGVQARLTRTAECHREIVHGLLNVRPLPDHPAVLDYQHDAADLHRRLAELAEDRAVQAAEYALDAAVAS